MSRSGSSDLAKGKKFTKQLMYVQHVYEDDDTASTISEQSLHEYLLDNSQIFSDSNFAEYLRNPKANIGILKCSLKNEIVTSTVCTNPLPAIPKTAVTIHAFVVLVTEKLKTKNYMYYSLEKNGQYIVLQQSPVKDDVMYKLYDPVEKKLVKRLGPVKRESFARGNEKKLEYLIQAIWKTNQLSTKYHLLFSNCQNFAKFVFREASFGGKKWSTPISWIGLRNKKSQTEFEADTLNYHEIIDAKFAYYKAMAEGRRQDFEELAGNLTSKSLNSVDFLGYTLLEWATVFSTSDWPIDQFLMEEKGAKTPADKKLFRHNVFFIALQYLPSKKESRYLSFDGINIHGVNQTGDTALHLALYWKKWDVAERILDQFPDYDVNASNSLGYTPLHLAVHPKCKIVLIKKILARMNSKSVNTQDERGWTALHDAIDNQSEIAVKELLKRMDVDVNLKNNSNYTILHLASHWVDIPIDLFRVILEKSANINEQDKDGDTALHYAIHSQSEIAVKELLKRDDVNVNLKNKEKQTLLHYATIWQNVPIDFFRVILEKSTDVNAQEVDGNTALNYAIIKENRTAVEELLKHKDVDVNLKKDDNRTALHFAAFLMTPIELFRKILEKSADVNAKDEGGDTALHWAITGENRTAVEELLKHVDVYVNKNNETALHFAAGWEHFPIDLFKLILEKSTNVVNVQDKGGDTALHWAISSKSETATKQLLEHNDVNVNLKNEDKRTALHFAVNYQTPIDLFKVIIEKSANINAQDKHGWTALHCAILNGSTISLEELLKHVDVNVNLKNDSNYTILHLASHWVDIPIDLFKLILEKSVDVKVKSDGVKLVNAQDAAGKTALHLAIKYKSKTATKQLLEHNDVDVNLLTSIKRTALHYACFWKDMPIDLFRVILEKSANVNEQDEDGHTALHWAFENEHKAAVEELLKRDDVDLNLKNNDNQTALHLAAEVENMPIDLFKIILEKSTHVVNAQDIHGNTALHLAIRKSETATKQLLEHKKVDVDLKNEDKNTALHLAAIYETPIDLFKVIIEKSANINAQDKHGWTALHYTIGNKSITAVEKLLNHKNVKVTLKNNKNQTALNLCSEWKDIPANLLKIINDKTTAAADTQAPMNSESVNAQNKDGNNALHYFILNQSEIAVKELLKRDNVDVNLKNNNNVTALHFAITWEEIPINLFTKILEKSTDINAQDKGGDTALHWAIVLENRTAAKELLERKDIDVNIKNNNKRTPLHLAFVWVDIPIDLFRIISEKTYNINLQDRDGHTAFHLAMSRQSTTMIEELLKHRNLDVNLKNNDNQTALHFACYFWKNMPIELFRVILEKTTDVNALDERGNTALHYAIGEENETVVEELLKCKDVDGNLKNNDNQTALHLACYFWKNMPIELFRVILEKSADINAQDKDGDTALYGAIIEENKTAVKELLKRMDVDVNLQNIDNQTALNLCSDEWKDIPANLLKIISEKTTAEKKVEAKNGCISQ